MTRRAIAGAGSLIAGAAASIAGAGALIAAVLVVAAPGLPARASVPSSNEPYRVGLRTVRIVEHRTMRLPDGQVVPRTLVTYVRYPLGGHGHYPLIVFGHGFAVTPHPYAQLLTAWARAGFVVAAPVFPLSSARARGGPDEGDIINQPGDMSAVITHLIVAGRRSGNPFSGLIDDREVAVAGQSDGASTALATAYNRRLGDRRVRAAVILSGNEWSVPGFSFAPGSPALMAVQGTADTSNLPRNTYEYFARAGRPKFLLRLLGAGHLPPYTTEEPQVGIVERTSIDFLRRYLEHRRGALAQLKRAARVSGLTGLTADP